MKSWRAHYSEESFWGKLRRYGKHAGVKVVYAALLMFYAYRRKETPRWAKGIVLGVLGYFLAPIDTIPDLTPLLGYTDDMGVLAFGLVVVAAYINEGVRLEARRQLGEWFGDYDEKDIAEVEEKL